MCACSTAKRRRRQSRMKNGRKPPKYDWKLALANKKRAS